MAPTRIPQARHLFSPCCSVITDLQFCNFSFEVTAWCTILGHAFSFEVCTAAAGNSYEVITASNGNVIGNFSLVSTPLTANAVALTLPPTFNATQLLSTGSYTAVITYYPTINFTMPIPLTITFTITVQTLVPSRMIFTAGVELCASCLLCSESIWQSQHDLYSER